MPYDESFDSQMTESGLGDGYERVQTTGINPVRRTYNLQWVPMDISDAHTLRNALLGTNYTETVTWTPDGEETQRNFRVKDVRCRLLENGSEKQVSCTLREKFL
jgi:phage-related protein